MSRAAPNKGGWSLHADLRIDCSGRSATIRAAGRRIVVNTPTVSAGWRIADSLRRRGSRWRLLRQASAAAGTLGLLLEWRVRNKLVLEVGGRQSIPLRLLGISRTRLRPIELVRQWILR